MVKKVMFVFILKILSEGPHKGFFKLLKTNQKAEKRKKWQEAQKKTQVAWKEKGTSTEKSISSPNVPLSLQQPEAPAPMRASTVSSLAKKELKILEFKSRKGLLTKAENK
jgi:hypothetical protein